MYAYGYKVIMIKATREILEGQEITVDYERNFGRHRTFKCLCNEKCDRIVGQYVMTAKEESDIRSTYAAARREMEMCGLLPTSSDRVGVDRYKDILKNKCREVAKLNQAIVNAASLQEDDSTVVQR